MLFVYEIVFLKIKEKRNAPYPSAICLKAGHTFTKVPHLPSPPGRTRANHGSL